MIKKKSVEVIVQFTTRIIKAIEDGDEKFINIMSQDTLGAMIQIRDNPKVVGKNVHLRVFFSDGKLVGGIYGLVSKGLIYNIHSILFDESPVGKRDLIKSYYEIFDMFKRVDFNVAKGGYNEKFHDVIISRIKSKCSYFYKKPNGSFVNIKGEKVSLVEYNLKFKS